EHGSDPVRAIDDDGLRAVVVVEPDGVRIVAERGAPLTAGIVESVVGEVLRGAPRAGQVATAAAALEPGEAASAAEGVPAGGRQVRLVEDPQSAAQLDPAVRGPASMATMFLLFVALFGVTGLLHERDGGTLARILAAPIPRWSVVVSKVAVSIVLAVVAGLAI